MHVCVCVNISDVYSSLYSFEVGKVIDILMSLVLKGIGENITIGKNMARRAIVIAPPANRLDPNIVAYISIIIAVPTCMICLCRLYSCVSDTIFKENFYYPFFCIIFSCS